MNGCNVSLHGQDDQNEGRMLRKGAAQKSLKKEKIKIVPTKQILKLPSFPAPDRYAYILLLTCLSQTDVASKKEIFTGCKVSDRKMLLKIQLLLGFD